MSSPKDDPLQRVLSFSQMQQEHSQAQIHDENAGFAGKPDVCVAAAACRVIDAVR
ncbi:MAG: hypothetical protein HC829_05785 [Bacteroidales bacterium]|nr:hypothetical protein [Bacteroidales bacterium]